MYSKLIILIYSKKIKTYLNVVQIQNKIINLVLFIKWKLFKFYLLDKNLSSLLFKL